MNGSNTLTPAVRTFSRCGKPDQAQVPRLLSLFVLAILIAGVASQPRAQGLHVRGGINFANAELDPEPTAPNSTSMLRAYNAALLAEIGGGPVRLLLGAGYEQHGIKINGAGGGDFRLDYGTIPVMIGIGSPSVNANSSLFFNFGVEPSFLMGSQRPNPNTVLSEEDTDDFDLALRTELGVELPVSYSGPSIMIMLGYRLGMTDVNRGDNEWRNATFQGIVGLKFRTL